MKGHGALGYRHEQHERGHGGEGELEADIEQVRGFDEQQDGGHAGEEIDAVAESAEQPGISEEDGHESGAVHRGGEAGERGVGDHDHDDEHEGGFAATGTDPDIRNQEPERREQEADVHAGDGHEVGESGAGETEALGGIEFVLLSEEDGQGEFLVGRGKVRPDAVGQ